VEAKRRLPSTVVRGVSEECRTQEKPVFSMRIGEGQTRRIAKHVAADLRRRGFEVEISNVRKEPAISLDGFSAAVIAASVHVDRHESEMVKFVKRHRAELERLPAAFLSVSLSEAGAERANASPEQRAQASATVHTLIHKFLGKTGWDPKRVKPVAGALLYTKYNPLIRFVMKQIVKRAGGDTDTTRDYEYTDWVALDRFLEEFVAEIQALDLATEMPESRQ
jgi:menaquinone-dependent protoporphyrinogen oxidase